jgi:phage tail-like protein
MRRQFVTVPVPPKQVSTYLQYLPAIMQENADEQGVAFLGRWLLAFEQILSGLGDPAAPGLEEIIDRIYRYFDPGPGRAEAERAPSDFLPWLAGWVALTLREDWSEAEKRRIISEIVPVYRQRGTKAGLTTVLQAYIGSVGAEIEEFNEALQLGVTSTVGINTVIGGGPPHYFLVKIILPGLDDLDFSRKEQIARAIIEQEKPAHTYYDLHLQFPPTMQIGVRSTVGVDTLLSTRTSDTE